MDKNEGLNAQSRINVESAVGNGKNIVLGGLILSCLTKSSLLVYCISVKGSKANHVHWFPHIYTRHIFIRHKAGYPVE